MRLAVSNIAWESEEDAAVRRLLGSERIDAIEVAPTRLAPNPTSLSKRNVHSIRRRFEADGLEVVAMQSLLFEHPEMRLFGSEAERDDLRDYLLSIIRLAGGLGASRLVFGSPRNRRIPDDRDEQECFDVAVDFFRRMGDAAHEAGAVFCIEPNPVSYGCNFVVTSEEGAILVDAVAHPGFGLHLDGAGATLAGEDVSSAVRIAGSRIRHFHASAPQLGALEDELVDHRGAAAALRAIDYPGIVSIEMRSGGLGNNEHRVRDAVRLAQARYGRVSDATGRGSD